MTISQPAAAVPAALDHSLSWHLRRTARLAAPIATARAAILVMYVVDSVMTGWAGADALAALGLGIAPQLVFMLVGIGFLQSVAILTAQGVGAGEEARTGKVLRAGLVQAALLGFVVLGVSYAGGWFFGLTNQPEAIVPVAAAVTVAFGWGAPGMLLFVAANLFLEATGRPKIGMAVMLAANVLNVPANLVFVLGWGGFVEPMGAVGAIATSSALRWLAFFATFGILLVWEMRQGDPRGVIAALKRPFARDAAGVSARMGRIGLPIGLAQGAESAAFAAMVFLAGLIGEDALAAHQATISLVTFVYMIAIGVAGATAIRVGNAVGRNAPSDLRLAGWSGILLAGLLASPFALLFLLAPERVAGLYGLDGAALTVTAGTVALAGTVLVFDGMMGASLGALRGAGDVWAPLAVQTGVFWLVAVPLAALFGIALGYGAPGLMLGILAGCALAFTLLALRFRAVARRPLRRF